MKKIESIAKQVKQILIDYPETRNNDYLLWIKFIELCTDKSPLLVESFRYIVENLRELGIPNFETIGRARRKVQEKNPDLNATESTQKHREEREVAFREFAHNGLA